MNSLIKVGVAVFAFVVFASMVSQCNRRSAPPATTAPPASEAASTNIILKEFSKGLDLKAVTELAKKAKDAADFEKLLNSEAEAVNNIDLNEDGKVDYIKVTEYGSGDLRGFSLTTELAPGQIQEIATIEFQREQDKATVQTTGNTSLYGPGYYNNSSFGLTDVLLMGWLFSNRPSYSSPYGYGNYPSSYGSGWNTRPAGDYGRAMTARTAGSTVRTASQPAISKSLTSPNENKVAAKARAIANPTRSQRSFSTGDSSASSSPTPSRPKPSASNPSGSSYGSSSSSPPVRSGGFGRSTSSGSSRSGSSFGGGK